MATLARHTDPQSIESCWNLRKLHVTVEEVITEARAPLAATTTLVTAAAVVGNPWIGEPTDSDLQTPVREIAPRLAKLLTDRVLDHVGDAGKVEAFGKGAIIGSEGELEHGAALLHTPYFANLVREFLEGTTVISFADERGEAGTPLVVPLCRKDPGPTRNHFQTVSLRIGDAPRPDEIVLVVAASTGTRPFPRVGDRTTDPEVNSSNLKGVFL